MFCTKCGKENEERNKFCFNCGCALNQTQSNHQDLRILQETNNNLQTILQNPSHIPCKGMIKNGKVFSSTGIGAMSNIKIKSYWKEMKVIGKKQILFDYDPINKEAFNIREYPVAKGISENYRIDIKGGDFKSGIYYIIGDGSGLRSESTDFVGLYNAKISVVTAERAQQKLKSLAIGAVGSLATLGIGAVLGAMHASKKYNTIEVETESGKFFIAQCRPLAYQTLYSAIKSNQGVVSNFEAEKAFTKSPNCKKIETFSTGANLKEIVSNIVTYGLVGLLLLAVLKACANN